MTTDRADNVNDGSGVFYRGVNVGQVTTIARSADNEHVLIGAEINNTPPLPDNLVGAIRAQARWAVQPRSILSRQDRRTANI